jgi:hypothetical protein
MLRARLASTEEVVNMKEKHKSAPLRSKDDRKEKKTMQIITHKYD